MFNSEVINSIISSVLDDINNISRIDEIAPLFIQYNLKKELVELYKMEFYYSMNPVCFEKIGDIYYEDKEYDKAIDFYLSCAEGSENYLSIFKKLADTFEKNNDFESSNACREQIKLLEDNNE